jgi:hypothetical protein
LQKYDRIKYTIQGGLLHKRKDGFLAVEFIPFEIRALSNEDKFKRLDLTKCWNKGFIQKDKQYIRMLGPD